MDVKIVDQQAEQIRVPVASLERGVLYAVRANGPDDPPMLRMVDESGRIHCFGDIYGDGTLEPITAETKWTIADFTVADHKSGRAGAPTGYYQARKVKRLIVEI